MLVATMCDQPPAGTVPGDRTGYIAALATMASDSADILIARDADAQLLTEITDSYAPILGLAPSSLRDATEYAVGLLEKDRAESPDGKAHSLAPMPADILIRGIADMRACAAHVGAGQLITMALETMHEAFDAVNTIVFLRNPALGHYAAKLMIGPDPRRHLSGVTFSEAFQPDAFHAALANDQVILVENTGDAGFTAMLPPWWDAATTGTRHAVIVPLLIAGRGNHQPERQPVGLICCNGNFGDAAVPDRTPIELLDKMRKLITDALVERA